MMKKFIIYNLLGEILRVGSCPEIALAIQAQEGEFLLEGEADGETQMVIDGLVVEKPVIDPVFDIVAARDLKYAEITKSRINANLSSFNFDGQVYAANQTAQNDLNAIANYSSMFGALPPDFPGAWAAIDGAIRPISTVDDFKPLYSAMVKQGSVNFMHMQYLFAYIEAATTQAELDLITW
jgi:hypothetical protein